MRAQPTAFSAPAVIRFRISLFSSPKSSQPSTIVTPAVIRFPILRFSCPESSRLPPRPPHHRARASSTMSSPSPTRCSWVSSANPAYVAYHDHEWGRVPPSSAAHFELLCLESAQSGLSWATILRKRPGYRAAFSNFDAATCAALTDEDLARILAGDAGDIVRHRGKVAAVRASAVAFLGVLEEFGEWHRFLRTVLGPEDVIAAAEEVGSSDGSMKLAKALKSRGFKFVGPTTVYAYMQAAGIVNDHASSCFYYQECEEVHERMWGRATWD